MPTPENTETFVNVVKGTPTQSSTDTGKVDSLESIVNDLREESKKLAAALEATNKSVNDLAVHVNSELSIVREDITRVQENTNDTVKKFIEAQKVVNEEKDKKEAEFKAWLVTSLGLKQSTPSGVEQSSARGGNK